MSTAQRKTKVAAGEVLTLTEATDFLRVPEAVVQKMAVAGRVPGRRVGADWRFSRSALLEWLAKRTPKQRLLDLAGRWKDDPSVNDLLAHIYKKRGRPMVEERK